MFNSIRKAIAQAIAPSSIKVDLSVATEPVKSLTLGNKPAHVLTQHERQHTPLPMVGHFHVSHLDELNSEYLKNAIASLGTWSCLAKAFSEYERVYNKRAANEDKLNALLDEFHCWNAALPSEKQMNEDEILIAVDRMATVKPVKGNDQTDSIIARVRGRSVEEVREERINTANKQTQTRQGLIESFVSSCWHYTSSDLNPCMPSAKVAAKAIQTLEWIANTWQGEPAGIAAELLMIEQDIKVIEKLAQEEEVKTDDTFIDGTLTADGLVRNAVFSRRFGEERPDLEPKTRQMIRVPRSA